MDIPKKIEKLINQRCRYAELVEKIDYELQHSLRKIEQCGRAGCIWRI